VPTGRGSGMRSGRSEPSSTVHSSKTTLSGRSFSGRAVAGEEEESLLPGEEDESLLAPQNLSSSACPSLMATLPSTVIFTLAGERKGTGVRTVLNTRPALKSRRCSLEAPRWSAASCAPARSHWEHGGEKSREMGCDVSRGGNGVCETCLREAGRL